MKTQDYIDLEYRYTAFNYKPLPVVISKGRGVWLWDVEGRKMMDFMSAYSSVNAGHVNPRIKRAVIKQISRMDVPSRAFLSDRLGPYAEKLCKVTGLDAILPMNSGAEAVETAIKAARRWGYMKKGIPHDKARIIVSAGNFHGRTTTIIGFSSEPAYKKDFGPFSGGFDEIPFGDTDALERAITPDTCAFFTEPIQGEAGIIVPPAGWIKKAQEICKRHNVLFILDEIQSGMGRTGKNFAFQHEIDRPDGITLGKALGGGIYPVSAFVATKDVMDVFNPGSHGTTFGGNPVAAAIGYESLCILEDDKLAERSAKLGAYLQDRLRALASPLVTDIRGKGLWIGVDIDPKQAKAVDICLKLRDEGILAKETHDITLRFAPPLVITKRQIDWAMKRIEKVLGTRKNSK